LGAATRTPQLCRTPHGGGDWRIGKELLFNVAYDFLKWAFSDGVTGPTQSADPVATGLAGSQSRRFHR